MLTVDSLERHAVSHTVEEGHVTSGLCYRETDEKGIPFAATVDADDATKVTLRERDSMRHVCLPVSLFSSGHTHTHTTLACRQA